ncbi:MAG: hypothetical protein A2901_07310 [Elusimicrobia bacterium RIFCSPLOWO2_01_FULL_54_10]|nr:MAG: hypothetical protein A2901_07310 [Elusimicrobia bacterium RIFCSPLOWO2_01_FULL_54_10]
MKVHLRLFRFLKPYMTRFIQAGICMVGVASLTAAPVWLVRFVMDDVLIAKDRQMLLYITLAFPAVYLLKGVFTYIQNYMMSYIGHAIVRDIRQTLYEHLQGLSLDFYHRTSTGKLMSRVTNDTTTLQIAMVQVPIQIIRDGLTLIFLISTILYLNWKFALITLVLLPIAAVPVSILGKKLRRAGREINVEMADLFASIHEGIGGHVVTKIFGKEQDEIERFRQDNRNYYSAHMRWVRANILGAPVMEFMGSIAAGYLLWVGGNDVITGQWSVGSFAAFLFASISAYKPVKDFTSVNATIQQGTACAERIFEILDEKPSVQAQPGAGTLPPFKNSIEYRGVSFSYGTGPVVLDHIDLSIRAGEVVALVGASGAGKTTITHLLPRLMDVTDGAILIDGTDIRGITIESLRSQIGIVTQDVILFNDTVAYNIAYGKEAIRDPNNADARREIVEAAKVANAHGFITALPQGYDTLIGERGIKLSGGQRQRLSVARAVLRNPPILILDEATSSLDAESEQLVQQALERLMEHRTVLVVAHRLSTVRRADRILVIENGRVIEEGTHDRLIENDGRYKKLYQIQVH